MGIDSRKAPPLPAPTETETNNTTPTELTADAFKPIDDKSSYSIPEDGTPVTIPTRGHKASRSQTSLLIEYFEGGKPSSSSTGERRPSVRVRLTPSKSRGDHIQVTETKVSRKASQTRRIPLGLATDLDTLDGDDGHSMTSYASATEESNVSRNPIDIEIDRSHRRRRPASPLIPSESYQVNASDISAIPSDSFLDGTGAGSTELKSSFSHSKGEELAAAAGAGVVAAVAMDEIKSQKSRNRERVKLTDKPKEKPERKRRSKSRTSSVSERTGDDLKSSRPRRSSRSHQESTVSAADSSVLSSNLTPSHRSVDTHSTRSAVSKSSINNPKLLETVEDAIRRLILPELSALKREQSKRETRRGSFTSTATSVSRDEMTPDRRRSSGQRSDQKDRRNREARHDYGDVSPQSMSRESLDDYDHEIVTPKRSGDLLKAAAAGAAASKGLSLLDEKTQSEDRKHRERRRRRAESSRSRSLGRDRYVDDYDDDVVPAPPMPLMSEINASELTRTSILSANTDRPHSATEELTPVQNVNRGGPHSAISTPTPSETPVNIEDTLLTQHANVSHGDLTALPRGENNYQEYETDDFGRKVPMSHDIPPYDDEEEPVSDNDYPDAYDNSYFATQDVPPPLKYVPYQAGARGLSPIPSVSGYTDGASEHQPRNSRSMHSASDLYSQLERSPEHPRNSRSSASLSSLRGRDFDPMSPRSSGVDYRNSTYTNDSELERVASGQAVRGVGANPTFHHPMGVESAVASLVDGSMLDQSVLTSGSGYDYGARDSNLSYDDQSRVQSSRGVSPVKSQRDVIREVDEESHATPSVRSQKSQPFSEFEIDENGRKVPRTKSPTASEVAITAGAVAALRAAQGKRQTPAEEQLTEEQEQEQEHYQPAGVFRNKSFKERTLEGHEPRNTPTHSVDRLDFDEPKMSASFMPDGNHFMPEIGYMDDDARTNPSIVQTNPSVLGERLDGDELLSARATPTQRSVAGLRDEARSRASGTSGHGIGVTEAVAAGAAGAAAAMAASHTHSREPSHDHDDWQMSSEDHKRDTLVTNPYEDASPIVNPALNENLLGARALNSSYGAPYQAGSPGFTQKYDEGYMSNGPNRTPDVERKTEARNLPGSSLGPPVPEDPFYVSNKDVRHLSGMSQGMASPFYDAATGQGIERIENKDIVALMQHLMVRDAQRSARDTEIVALLMNAALEMRTSFQEMRDLIQDTGDDVIFAGSENTEKLQKAINGPRPYPGNRSSFPSNSMDTINEASLKKKNLWKRALQGLSAKGTSDLSRIEEMLMQLLGEVDVLKTQTAPPPISTSTGRGPSFENLQPEGQYEQDRGYEPEGNSTASHASQSGHLSLSHSRSRLRDERKFSDNRISTVQEHEEEYRYDHPSPSAERTDANLLTPTRSATNIQRGGSVPLETPPQPSGSTQHPLSAENTPRTGKKHKASGSSGWLPKISRWSGTTASSVGKAFKGSGKKESKYEDYAPSRSGSSIGSYRDDEEYQRNPYEEDKLHTGFSEQNLAGTGEDANVARDTNFTPDEAPKYKVHRNSLNLQHPQPRPGQTERFRNALESSAQEYDIPMTPRSADWAGSATSVNRIPQNTNRYSTASSGGAREPEYWATSPTGPPRPPKELADSPATHTPPRSTRVSKLAKSPLQHQTDESGYPSHYAGSPKPENRNLNAALGIPARRPSGPRAMTPKSPEEEAAREDRRRKRDTFGTIASAHTDDTDTF